MMFYKSLFLQLLFFPLLINAAVITVYIAIYDVLDSRDPNHWAIYLDGERDVILQVGDDIGGVGYFVEQPIYNKKPQRSSRHKESIAVGSISSNKFNDAIAAIQNTPVDNNSNTWNCQAWAIEALDTLSDAGLFNWQRGKKQTLQAKRQNWQK
ncbi:hypothetical protein CH63R_14388 [Colletotrichum higginsianum IMI 349063]|uniref:Uncharacterized protein n=1 Tax=Colletotrichum higginsianum (strain IMI 349063) TaxID=759273 RepID=A0A1B7XQQ1_COLHI|nr:hypothetical protein CH63R_14388 [Colletotrichum higginsianum IMI 349063]OBR02087.1 hypothetical protein CH63R_14388 [Colletotrichum higginsianum IMI 349063]